MQNLFLVTSVINIPNLPLNYTNTRSVFTCEERFEQTIKTIKTIREKIPDSQIFLIECSDLNASMTEYLSTHVDIFINVFQDENCRRNVFSPYKALGELTLTDFAMRCMLENNIKFDNMFKISGRYFLNDSFDYEKYNNSNICIMKFDHGECTTILYKLTYEFLLPFQEYSMYSILNFDIHVGYETLFTKFINSLSHSNILLLDNLGVEGNIAVVNDGLIKL